MKNIVKSNQPISKKRFAYLFKKKNAVRSEREKKGKTRLHACLLERIEISDHTTSTSLYYTDTIPC